MRFFSIFLLFVFTGCGFLDDGFLLEDEVYDEKMESESIEFGGMSIYGHGVSGSGYGSYGCGGGSYGYSSYRQGRRVAKTALRMSGDAGEGEPVGESAKKNTNVAVDSRSSFVRLIDSYGAKKHSLEAHLP